MLKILSNLFHFIFLCLSKALASVFLSLFLLFPSFSFASFVGNSMCYSPVQLASLMSKPKNKAQAQVRKLEKQMKAGEHQQKKINKYLSKATDALSDSLDRKKLKQSSSKVALKIENYIESQQDGWDCKNSDSSSLFQNLYFIDPSILIEVLGEALMPSALGAAPDEQSLGQKTQLNLHTCGEAGGKVIKNPPPRAPNVLVTCKCENGLFFRNTRTKEIKCRINTPVKEFETSTNFQKEACEKKCNVWIGSSCKITGKVLKEGHCQFQKVENPTGYQQATCDKKCNVWTGSSCRITGKVLQEGRCQCPRIVAGPQMIYEGGKCQCIKEYQFVAGVRNSNKCIKKSVPKDPIVQCKGPACQKQCVDSGKNWNLSQSRCCDKDDKVCNTPAEKDDSNVELPAEKEKCSEEWKNNWRSDKAFEKGGNVQAGFCDRFAKSDSKKSCKKSLEKIQNWIERMRDSEENQRDLDTELEEQSDLAFEESMKKTEAGGLCIDCVRRVMAASRPTTGENVGNVLRLITGLGMTSVGYQVGVRAQNDLNQLRIEQGDAAQHDYYSLIGANAGFPFLSKGLYGLTRTNTPVGGWSCSPTVNPYRQKIFH